MPRLDRASLTAATVNLLARRTPYLEPELAGLADVVTPGSVCLDVGAAAGIYTVALAQLAGPDGEVHSVEPLSIAHPLWRRVLGARQRPNVRHHALALSTEPGRSNMSVPVGRHGGHVTGRSFLANHTSGIGSNAEFAGQEEVSVEVDTLDGLVKRAGLRRLDFIKIDVEGGELAVLRGGEQTIAEFRPAMLIEIEARHITRYQHSAEDVVTWLTSRGYTMHTWQDGWQPANSICTHARNYLFRPPAAPAAGATAAEAASAQ